MARISIEAKTGLRMQIAASFCMRSAVVFAGLDGLAVAEISGLNYHQVANLDRAFDFNQLTALSFQCNFLLDLFAFLDEENLFYARKSDDCILRHKNAGYF